MESLDKFNREKHAKWLPVRIYWEEIIVDVLFEKEENFFFTSSLKPYERKRGVQKVIFIAIFKNYYWNNLPSIVKEWHS